MATDLIYEPAGRAREYAPLALNLYRGCSHGCTYCYAPDACRTNRAAFHASPAPRVDVIRKLERELARGREVGMQRLNGQKDPVLLCFTTDPYQPLATETGITRRAIELLHEHGYPVHVLTKGGTRACADFDLLGQLPGDAFASTLTFTDDNDSAEWEPGAAPWLDRLEAIREAHSLGIQTWVSLEPVVDPRQTIELIELTAGHVDLFKVGTLNHHPLARTIDWSTFAQDVVALLDKLGTSYYLKTDLARYQGCRTGRLFEVGA